MWAPETLPDSKTLLEVLAKAESRITNNPAESTLDPARASGNVQMGIEVDGVWDFVNFPLPSPDGSRPYRFSVAGKLANARGTPIYTLEARDARTLGAILNALEPQKPAR